MRRDSRPRPVWLALLFWAVVHGKEQQGLRQHRVKRSTRKVKYHEHFQDLADKIDPFSKFWIPTLDSRAEVPTEASSRSYGEKQRKSLRESSRRNLVDSFLKTPVDRNGRGIKIHKWEGGNGDLFWSLHGDASFQSPEDYYEGQKNAFPGKRTLTEQFVGQDEEPNVGNSSEFLEEGLPDDELPGETNGWNLTSEVEYGVNETDQTNATSSVVFTSGTPVESNETETNQPEDDIYQPIRIRAILGEGEQGGGGQFLDEVERDTLFQLILSPAMLAWSSALRVNPVVGNLTVDAEQLYDGVTCGPGIESGQPSVPVPPLHFTEGIPETDLVLYLSLGFTEPYENARQPTQRDRPPRVPGVGLHKGESSFQTNFSLSEDLGERPLCSGDYLAASSYCSTDQYDRPTAALLHLCISDDFFDDDSLNRRIITVMHELGHALGFNSHSFAHFRYPDGTPITPRVDGDVVDSEVECTGPSEGRTTASLPLPSEEILQFRTVRGVRVAEIVTPSVKQVIRNHFNCQELPGAELESGVQPAINDTEDAELVACIGDHWERRLMRTDLMNSLLDEVPFSFRITPLTLAVFADSGWYQVDLSRAQFSSGWGRSAGCSFVEDPCINEQGDIAAGSESLFCNEPVTTRLQGTVRELSGCSPDLSRKATCSISEYPSDIPVEYSYFNNTFGAHVAGSEPLIDYCPVYTGFSNGLCKSQENQPLLRVSNIEEFGKKNSRCVSGLIDDSKMALCVPIACVIQDQALMIKTSRYWQTCQYAGQRLTIPERSTESVICPDPRRICPTFYCRRDCLGTGGVCDYPSGECLCNVTTINGTTVGKCGPIYSEDQVAAQVFHDDVSNSESPLSDIYYATPEVLDDDDGGLNSTLKAIVVTASCLGGILALFIAWRFRGVVVRPVRDVLAWIRNQISMSWISPVDEDENMDEKEFANKDIMIASMLVDMRLHHPQLELECSDLDFFKETDASVNGMSVTESENSSQLEKSSEFESVDLPEEDSSGLETTASAVPAVQACIDRPATGIMRRRKKT